MLFFFIMMFCPLNLLPGELEINKEIAFEFTLVRCLLTQSMQCNRQKSTVTRSLSSQANSKLKRGEINYFVSGYTAVRVRV